MMKETEKHVFVSKMKVHMANQKICFSQWFMIFLLLTDYLPSEFEKKNMGHDGPFFPKEHCLTDFLIAKNIFFCTSTDT